MCVWPPPGSLRPRPAAGAAAVTLEQREGGGGTDRRMCVLPFFWGGVCHAQGGPPHPPLPPPSARAGPMAGGGPQPPRPTPESFPAFRFLLNYPHSQVAGGGGGVDPGGEETPLPPIQPQNVTPSSCARSFGVTGWGLGVKGGLFPPQNPAVSLARAPGTPGGTKTPVLNPWGRLIPPRPPAPTRSSAPQNKDAARAPTPPFCSALGKRG